MSAIAGLIETYNTTKKSLEAQIQASIGGVFQEFFAKNPEFKSAEWTQYTPYFNDGDSCSFGVNEISFVLQPAFYDAETRAQIESDDYDADELPNPLFVPKDWQRTSGYWKDEIDAFDALSDDERAERLRLYQVKDEFADLVASIPEAVMEAAFGDHVKVIATIDGAETIEYEHD